VTNLLYQFQNSTATAVVFVPVLPPCPPVVVYDSCALW